METERAEGGEGDEPLFCVFRLSFVYRSLLSEKSSRSFLDYIDTHSFFTRPFQSDRAKTLRARVAIANRRTSLSHILQSKSPPLN